MARKLRAGVVGVKGIGRAHIKGYTQCDATELVALADVDGKVLAERANEHGVSDVYTDPAKMFARRDIDVVSLGVPNKFHCPLTVAALRAGKHVLCEKPMAMSVAEGRKMAQAARKAKRALMIALCHRHTAPIQALKKFVDAGQLGPIYYANGSILRRRGIPGYGGWFTTKKLSGGGAMIDNGVHIIDLAWWLMGRPRPVACSAVTYAKFGRRKDVQKAAGWNKTKCFDVEDLAAAMVRFDNGAALFIELSWSGNTRNTLELSLAGEKGGAYYDFKDVTIFGEDKGQVVDIMPQVAFQDRFVGEVTHFADCILRGRAPISGPADGLAIQSILDSAYRSAKTGREVRVPKV